MVVNNGIDFLFNYNGTANVPSLKSLIYLTGPAGSVERFNENSHESHRSSAAVNVLILKFYAGLHGELQRYRQRASLARNRPSFF